MLADPERAAVLLPVVLLAALFLRWAVLPARHVPRFRIATMRLRLRLRLHPGRGFATLWHLWSAWGRFASFRESSRCRPGLTFWQRAWQTSAHSLYFGRAHLFHGVRAAIQECWTVVGRSRSGKSGWLAKVIIRWHGALVSASTKPDQYTRTSGLRARRGRPVYRFNPERVGGPGMGSTFWLDPIAGCEVPSVAMRHGTAFTDAVRTKGTEDGNFWSEQASVQLPALFCAAALGDLDLRAPHRWVLSGDTREAERILRANGRPEWAHSIAQMRGANDKTGATVRMVLNAALKFMQDPALAECVLPGPGEAFDIGAFLAAQGTLYMIADPRNDVSPVAPVFSFIANEIHWTASQLAARMRGERIDPPLLMALDEVTKLCPGLAVPSLVSDSGGRGITMVIACQGLAQIEERWGKPAMRMLLDTSAQAYLSGVQDPDTLDMAARLCDTATYHARGRKGETTDVPAATPGMIRRIPKRRALLLRGDCAPVIAHLPMAWHDWAYRWARIRRRLVAQVPPAPPVVRLPATARRSAVWGPPASKPAWLAPPPVREALPAGVTADRHQGAPEQPAPAYPWDQR